MEGYSGTNGINATVLAGGLSASGTYPNMTAGDITPKSNSPIEIIGRYIAQTTGGDADIKSGTAYLRAIKGFLDDDMNPFIAESFVSTNMNLVDPDKTITVRNYTGYYFPVAAGTWGEYGTTQENNGYVIISEDTVDNVIFYSDNPTSVDVSGVECPYEEYDGKRYYLPPTAGWLAIFMAEDDAAVPACHIAWSNYKDDVAGNFGNSVIDISSAITAVHSWGLAGFVTAGKVVQDVIDLENGVGYQYCDRVRLQDLSWSMETVTTTDENDETTTTYVFSARISDMAANGLYKHPLESFDGVENDGNLIVISTTEEISSVAELKESLGEVLMYYEKATPVEVNLPEIGTEFTANDLGLTYFLYNNELATTYAYVTAAFYQGGKDQFYNAVIYQKLLAEVVATALCEVNQRLSAIENRKSVSCTNLVVERKFDMAGWRHVDTQPAAATSPGRIGDYYITSNYLFICVDTDTWKKIAIANF